MTAPYNTTLPTNFPSLPECQHAMADARVRTRSNGITVWVLQCLTCGNEVRALKKTSPEVLAQAQRTPFDDNLREQWDAQWRNAHQRRYEHYQEHLRSQQAALEAEREQQQAAWWENYATYLQSREWHARRKMVLDRANGLCEGCRARKATQVHHLTYEHVCNEFLWELVAICDSCHRRIHPDKW